MKSVLKNWPFCFFVKSVENIAGISKYLKNVLAKFVGADSAIDFLRWTIIVATFVKKMQVKKFRV